MSRTIWKYELPPQGRFTLDIPKDHGFLDVQMRGNTPALWALVDTDSPRETVRFAVVGTGGAYPDAEEGAFWYLGTFQFNGGSLVYHLFYRNPWAE